MSSICLPLVIEVGKAAGDPNSFNWLALAPAAIAAGVAGAGWWTIERFARRREMRSDLRAAVESVSNAIEEVRVAAVTFYGLPGNDTHAQSLAASIRSKIQAVGEHMEVLRRAGLTLEVAEPLKRFRQTITGGDFDSLARQPLPSGSLAFARMAGDAEALKRSVQASMLQYLLPASTDRPRQPAD